MKRIILISILSLLAITQISYAGTISIQPFISNSDVTIAHLESQRQTIQNCLNGGIEGGNQNIRAGSITSSDEATSISIVTRFDEAFNDWTYSGMLATSSGTLSSTTSAGVSYINGVRVQTQATAHTYTASKDTYVYINAGGYFDYQEVANGASAPATPTNDLLLFKAVTNGTTVSSVADMRTTSIQIVVTTSNFATNFRDQAFVSRDSTVNFHVAPGTIAIGLANYSNTSSTTTKSIVTGANWIEGGYPSGYVGRVFTYVYNNAGSGYDFKFSSADVAFSDASSNTNGVLRYYINGGTTYRAIGWAYLSADTVQTYQTADLKDISVSSRATRVSTTTATTSSTSLANDPQSDLRFYSSGGLCVINWTAMLYQDSTNTADYGIKIDTVDIPETKGRTENSSAPGEPLSGTWVGILARGVHTIQGRFDAPSGNTATINSRIISVREE